METTSRTALDQYVATQVRRGDATVEPLSETSVVIVRRKKIRHVLHLVLTVLTGGIWAIPWIVMVLRNKPRRTVASVTADGTINES